jgi:hypothetical protein
MRRFLPLESFLGSTQGGYFYWLETGGSPRGLFSTGRSGRKWRSFSVILSSRTERRTGLQDVLHIRLS